MNVVYFSRNIIMENIILVIHPINYACAYDLFVKE